MAIKIKKNGVVQDLVINANEVRVLDTDGNFRSKNLESVLKELNATGGTGTGGGMLKEAEYVFVGDTEPDYEGVWLDTSEDSTEVVEGDNAIVKAIRDYIDTNVKVIVDKNKELVQENNKIVKDIQTNVGNRLDVVPQLSGYNLLINGDFRKPINQRNFSRRSYTGSNWAYGIDRWVIGILDSTGQSECILNDGYISLKSKANDGCINIYTLFENPQLYYGETFTASFKYRIVEGQPNCVFTTAYNNLIKNGTFFDYNKSENKLIADGQWHVYTFTYTVSGEKVNDNFTSFLVGTGMLQKNTDDDDYTWVKPTVDTQIDIEWAKLEIGSKATSFIPRPYGEELALCQRYYEKSNHKIRGIVGGDSLRIDTDINYKATKRVAPTVTIYGYNDEKNTIRVVSSEINLNAIIYANGIDGFGCIDVHAKDDNFTVVPNLVCEISGWESDAEIY